MKKASVISLFVIFTVVIFMSFTFNTVTDVQRPSFEGPKDPILVHVVGCDDCNEVYVCVDGSISYYFKTCDFYVSCNPLTSTTQTICVMCGDKQGSVTVYCPTTEEVYINVEASGNNCPCNSDEGRN